MKSLKIIHCANFNESKNGAVYYAIDNKLSNGFIRNGHFVYNFSYREIARNSTIFKSKKFGIKNVNNNLIKTIQNIKPDLLLLGHSELISYTTLVQIKNDFPNLKIAMWWVDPLINIAHIKHRLKILDALFATTSINELSKIFTNSHTCNFYYMPNMCDDSIDSYKSFESKNTKYDLVFLGRHDNERKEFLDNLKTKFKDLKVGLFGNTKKSIVLGKKYFDILTDTKIGLNLSRFNNIELYSSDRIIHLLANGVFTLSPRIPKLETLFNKNEIVYFDDFNDFKDKVYYYLKEDSKRMEIAKNGYKKAHTSYNSTRISAFMLEAIYENKLNKTYEWI